MIPIIAAGCAYDLKLAPKTKPVAIPDTFCAVYDPVWISRAESLRIRGRLVDAIDENNALWMEFCAHGNQAKSPAFCDAYRPIYLHRLELSRVRHVTAGAIDGNNAVWLELCER